MSRLEDAIAKAERARRALKRSGGATSRLHDIDVREVSMVPSPAVPAARYAVVKRADHVVLKNAQGEHVIPAEIVDGLKQLGGRL